LNKLVEVGDET